MSIMNDLKKVLDLIQHSLISKSSQQTRYSKGLPQFDQRHLQKSTAHVIHNNKILNTFLLRSG